MKRRTKQTKKQHDKKAAQLSSHCATTTTTIVLAIAQNKTVTCIKLHASVLSSHNKQVIAQSSRHHTQQHEGILVYTHTHKAYTRTINHWLLYQPLFTAGWQHAHQHPHPHPPLHPPSRLWCTKCDARAARRRHHLPRSHGTSPPAPPCTPGAPRVFVCSM